jgi:hypothetical protein
MRHTDEPDEIRKCNVQMCQLAESSYIWKSAAQRATVGDVSVQTSKSIDDCCRIETFSNWNQLFQYDNYTIAQESRLYLFAVE